MKRKVTIELDYQNCIESPPVAPKQMYSNACGSDTITVESWRKVWIDNVNANHARFGSFKDNSIASEFGKFKYKPCFIAGSGPSLGYNGEHLKDRGDIPLVSCLHNFHFFTDRNVKVDYWVTLDAGEVVLEEVSEGGSKTADEYWELTKDQTLVAFIGTSPKLFDKWKGKVLLFNAPVPDAAYMENIEKLERFNLYISNGGNVLGACMYFAKAILGCNPIAFVGADFSFSYDKKFHGWDSKYDAKLGYVIKAVDVYGNKVLTWQSYYNFKNWFDYIALTVPGLYINCTEGGCFGSFNEGNIMAVKQMTAKSFIEMYELSEGVKTSCVDPSIDEKRILF